MLSAFTQRLGLSAPTIARTDALSDDEQEAPSFPALNSQQRVKSASNSNRPAPPTFTVSEPDEYDNPSDLDDEDSPLPPVVIEKQALAAPTSTTKAGKRVKVHIEKGYSQLDWARKQRSGEDLRGGVTQLSRITYAELATHKTRDDCWHAYGGKVYNVTPFLKYHPGGVGEMMRAAGKDGTELFMKTHAWVNVDLMLDGCLVGFLVRE